MDVEIIYTSVKGTQIIHANGEPVQVGTGVVVWYSNGSLNVWENGAKMTTGDKFNGCHLVYDFLTRIVGEDYRGRCWLTTLLRTSNLRPSLPDIDMKSGVLLLTCDQVDRVLRGYPFASIVEECLRAATEKRILELEKEAEFARRARQVLTVIYWRNEVGGPGSRKVVKETILDLMPNAAHIVQEKNLTM